MSMIQLRSDYPHAYVGVPNAFIDNYMSDANGEFVKVYLYLLRCMNSSDACCTISAIADHFNHTENDILRALKYWEKVNVLSLELDENNNLLGLCFKDLTANTVAATTPVVTPIAVSPAIAETDVKKPQAAKAKKASSTAKAVKPASPSKREYTLDEVKAFCNNHEVSELLFIIETYLKHPLNSTEMNTVFFWYDGLHFSGELIEYLVEYCITNGHSSLRYMDKVAFGWAENNIDTIDKAKQHVSIRSKAYYSVMKAFGIAGRNLADSEMIFVQKWTQEYSFDIEIIQEACKRTISATQKPSFEYADTILTNWHNQNVHTKKDIEVLDSEFNKNKQNTTAKASNASSNPKPNKFNNFNQRTYDYDALEKVLLTTTVQ